jgi:hypothetical protein
MRAGTNQTAIVAAESIGGRPEFIAFWEAAGAKHLGILDRNSQVEGELPTQGTTDTQFWRNTDWDYVHSRFLVREPGGKLTICEYRKNQTKHFPLAPVQLRIPKVLPLTVWRFRFAPTCGGQPTALEPLRQFCAQTAGRNGKRARMARTKPASTLVEIISRGEKPHWRAHISAKPISAAVITMFGQALRAHCPDHTKCTLFENGNKYGIGH